VLLTAFADKTQMHQVMTNLCSNALDSMSAGGTLRVAITSVHVETERKLSHSTLRPGEYVCVAVEDDGCGMDAPTLGRLFEAFYTTKELGRGTGLGLTLVYAIVSDLDGAIDVNSTPGSGSTFSIYLPSAEVRVGSALAA
jgi:signal transduction histidine kinase